MAPIILYAWGFYYFIVRIEGLPTYWNKYKFDVKRLKATWINALKGCGLMVCGKVVAILLVYANRHEMDSSKIDAFLTIPLIMLSVITIARILNKRDEATEKKV